MIRLSLSLFVALSFFTAQSPKAQSTSPGDEAAPARELASFRVELLELAFGTASRMPLVPHVKNRARAQLEIARAALALDENEMAESMIAAIPNWRRGAGYAELAFHLAEQGHVERVDELLALAEQVSLSPEIDQAWRRDRIRIHIARTHALLGNEKQARAFEASVVDSEKGGVAPVRARFLGFEALDAELASLEAVLEEGGFDQVKNALLSYVELYRKFYGEEERRVRIEEKVRTAWAQRLPLMIRVDRLSDLTRIALDHGDQERAAGLVHEVAGLVSSVAWAPEDQIALLAHVGLLRHRSGQPDKGRAEVAAAMALFNEQRDEMVDIFRPEALIPIAEAYHAMGESSMAMAVYERAADEAMVNANSWPRAVDLAAICTSMAVHDVQPKALFMDRLRGFCESLSDPW